MCVRCVRDWAAGLVGYTEGVEEQQQKAFPASVVAPGLAGYSVTVADLAELVRLLDLCTVERPEIATPAEVRALVRAHAERLSEGVEFMAARAKPRKGEG